MSRFSENIVGGLNRKRRKDLIHKKNDWFCQWSRQKLFNLTFNFKRIFSQRNFIKRFSSSVLRSNTIPPVNISPPSVQLLVRSFSFAQWIFVSRIITLAGCGGRRLGPCQGDILWPRWRWKTVECKTKELIASTKTQERENGTWLKFGPLFSWVAQNFWDTESLFYGVYFSKALHSPPLCTLVSMEFKRNTIWPTSDISSGIVGFLII